MCDGEPHVPGGLEWWVGGADVVGSSRVGVPFSRLEERIHSSDLRRTQGLSSGILFHGRFLGRARMFPQNAVFTNHSERMNTDS